MADEDLENNDETTEEEGGRKKPGLVKIVLLVNGALLILGLIIALAVFFLGGSEDEEAQAVDEEVLGETLAEPTAEDANTPVDSGRPIYIPLNPAFVVNFENQDQVSFLQVDIQVMTYDPRVEPALTTHMPAVRNELLLLLSGKQYHEINTREGKRALSQEAMKVIQGVLKSVNEPNSIEALYFTSFVMQ
jgi:flagellar FliL protein